MLGGRPMTLLDNDSLCTPEWILDLVRSMGPIAFDPCSNEHSTVGAKDSYSLPANGLDADWAYCAEINGGSVWLNPPYSKPLPWCRKAAIARRGGAEVFALVKNDPTTRWTAALRSEATAVCHFTKRISFVGGKHKTGQMASTLWYLGNRPFLFAHTFQGAGDVRVYR